MIIIADNDPQSTAQMIQSLMLSDLERDIVNKKQSSTSNYHYDTLDALRFELKMRTDIVRLANALNDSGVSFATYKKSRSNPHFWLSHDDGSARLLEGVLPSDGINDIFEHGHMYAFECATAMVVIFYKAVLDMVGPAIFNETFHNLLLWNWNYDPNLKLIIYNDINEMYPGDVVYFKNPDHDPNMPEWQGENSVVVGRNQYFGHGIGIKTSEQMIAALNHTRVPGSTISAYLTDEVVHPDFEYVRKMSLGRALQAKIGRAVYSYRIG